MNSLRRFNRGLQRYFNCLKTYHLEEKEKRKENEREHMKIRPRPLATQRQHMAEVQREA